MHPKKIEPGGVHAGGQLNDAQCGFAPPRSIDEHIDQLEDRERAIQREIRDLKTIRRRQREDHQRAAAAAEARKENRAAAIDALTIVAQTASDPTARIHAAQILLEA